MDIINNMDTCQLVEFLATRNIPKEICDLLKENCIDGSNLLCLTEELDEFLAVLPKSGHRLKIKQLMKRMALEEETSKSTMATANATATQEEVKGSPLDADHIEVDSYGVPGSSCCVTPSSSIMSIDVDEEPMHSSTPITTDVSDLRVPSPADSKVGIKVKCEKNVGVTSGEVSIKKRKADDGSILPENLPFPTSFSTRVQAAIDKGSVLAVRRYLISDIGCFYFTMCKHPKQGDYKRMALLICQKFPELCDSNPSSFWLSTQKQISQYFRNQRRYSLNATLPKKEKNGTSTATKDTAKRMKLFKDDPEAQKRNLALLKDAGPGGMATKTYASLIKETFQERRKFIKETAKSSTEVLDMCPYLGQQKHIRQEMSRILQKDSFVEAENRVMAAFKGLLGKDGELRTTDIVNSVEMVAKRTGKRKPSSLIKFKDPSAKVENMFKDKVIQFWILCVGVPEDIQQVFVCGEDQAFIECPDTDLVKALVDVISCYYVFDVSYPDSLVGILTFLQEIALELYDSSHKGTKYATFMSELKSLINKK